MWLSRASDKGCQAGNIDDSETGSMAHGMAEVRNHPERGFNIQPEDGADLPVGLFKEGTFMVQPSHVD